MYFASVWIFWNTSKETNYARLIATCVNTWKNNLSIFDWILRAHLAFLDEQRQGIKYSSESFNWQITWGRERLRWRRQTLNVSQINHPACNCEVSIGWNDHIGPKKWSLEADNSKSRGSQGLNSYRKPQSCSQGGCRRPVCSWDWFSPKKGSATQELQ